MSKYISLILARHAGMKPFFCIAPAWSVETGDLVIVFDALAEVLGVSTQEPDSEVVAMAIKSEGLDSLDEMPRITYRCRAMEDPLKKEDANAAAE